MLWIDSLDEQGRIKSNLSEKLRTEQPLLEDLINTHELCPEIHWEISIHRNTSSGLGVGTAQNVLGPLLYSGRRARALQSTRFTHPSEAFLQPATAPKLG